MTLQELREKIEGNLVGWTELRQGMERKKFNIVLLMLVLVFSEVSCKNELETVQKERPNILLIMADDMGFSDTDLRP